MIKYFFYIIILFYAHHAFSDDFTSYFTGDIKDARVEPKGGICMMGGAAENDNAMKWFLERADGGDVLVLRTNGRDAYNDYLFSELNVGVNSVETLVLHNESASYDEYVLESIKNAEAIWFAGGNQSDYVSYWRDTPLDSIINENIQNNNLVIGGISAGMAILGDFYFSAKNGTITSKEALGNPYDHRITIDNEKFINIKQLQNVITDTHYDDPDRKGRHVVFLARILTDHGISAKGIACDEYTAICIDTEGKASIYGNYPDYEDNAYFIKINEDVSEDLPEKCQPDIPLEWMRNKKILKVYKVSGKENGSNTFDLSSWNKGNGGIWQYWYVESGILYESDEINKCIEKINDLKILLSPNPAKDIININSDEPIYDILLTDNIGKSVFQKRINGLSTIQISVKDFSKGVYFLIIKTKNNYRTSKLIIR